MNNDYYKTLGVAEDAGADEIKKVYRKLAKKFHPDRNKGDKDAEARFKSISEAYSTLSDDKKRAEYDMMRKYGAHGGPFGGGPQGGFGGNPFAGGGFGGRAFDFSQFTQGGGGRGAQGFGNIHGMEEIFEAFFGGGLGGSPFGQSGGQPFRTRRQRGQDGSDMHLTVTVSFYEAINGTSRKIRTRDKGPQLVVKIPAGIDTGGKVRVRGQGHLGSFGGKQGDLLITVMVMPDQNFERKGNDIYSSVNISFVDAIKGCKTNVKTLTRTLALSVPAGTQPGTVMRLKGQGLAVGGKTGDQYVTINVTIPKTLTEKQRKLLDEWET
ncbi:MAG: DnaJ domain-containing protein [candidate division Zixibacteria bacterium]|nr:DnaJ domain-containing protein [candidate division Zixibacteria bacterium]